MMKKILFLALILCISLGSTATAALVDEFDVSHDYLVDGFTGTIFDGLFNAGNTTALSAAGGNLTIDGSGDWNGNTTDGPFVYAEVSGNFIAELKQVTAGSSASGLMVRLADVAAGGDGEDNMWLPTWTDWGVGSIFWPVDNGARPELNITWDGVDAPLWSRVQRVGGDFYWSRSYDGVNWETLSSANPRERDDMDVATLQVGIAHAFGNGSIQFDYIIISQEVGELSGGAPIDEEGETSTTITIDLNGPAHTAPVDVVISEVSADANDLLLDGAESPLTVTFPVGTSQKTFTVQAIDDGLQEGPETVALEAVMISTDSNYGGNYARGTTVEVADNDQGTLVIDEGDGLVVDEDLVLSDTFTVKLTLPLAVAGTVTVDITSDVETDVSPTQLVFDETDWNVPQVVTVIAVDDTSLETDPHTGVISFAISSTDAAYAGEIIVPDISVDVQENECGAWAYSDYDYNEDCVVSLEDFAVLASEWGQCTLPHVEGCDDVR